MVSRQHKILKELSKYQDKILVCYRPTTKNSWSDRCLYNSEEYDKNKEYNHRSILDNEIVIEYDDEDPEINRKYANIVAHRISQDGIAWSKLKSGNKSTHLHCIVNVNGAMNLSLLKNAFIRHYTKGKKWKSELPLPDMGLCGNRLIRMEYGVHEKTQNFKNYIYTTRGYLEEPGTIPQEVWNLYDKMYERVQKWKSTNISKEVANSKQIKLILDCVRFNKYGDGRERALFILIHTLKEKYENTSQGKKDLTLFLQGWYKSSKGYKLTDVDIERKVNYHFTRSYTIGLAYLNTFLEELGIKDYNL